MRNLVRHHTVQVLPALVARDIQNAKCDQRLILGPTLFATNPLWKISECAALRQSPKHNSAPP